MIRVNANLMMVHNLGNSLSFKLKKLLREKKKIGELFIDLRVVDNEQLSGKGAKDIYVSVEKALKNAEFAIVIISKDDTIKDEKTGKTIYHPRPNVCYELGYLMSKLGRKNVLPLVDNTEDPNWRPGQPSDLKGTFQEGCETIEDAYTSIKKFLRKFGATNDAHKNWGTSFNFDSFQRFPTLHSYSEWVKRQVKRSSDKEIFGLGWKLVLEHSQCLLDEFGIEKAYRVTKPYLKEPSNEDNGGRQAYHMINAMFSFWATKDSLPKEKVLVEINDSLNKVAVEDQWEKIINNKLLQVLYCDYKGLVCESYSKPSISRKKKEQDSWKSRAEKWYKQAINEAWKLKGDLRYLWLGYLEFNLARMLADRESHETDDTYKLACIHRKEIVDKAKGTILEEGRLCQLAIALGFYMKYLSKKKADRSLKNVAKEYKDYLDPFVQTLGLPRSAMQARAITNLLGAGMDQILQKNGWQIPENTGHLVEVASKYSNKLGPILGAGYIDRAKI